MSRASAPLASQTAAAIVTSTCFAPPAATIAFWICTALAGCAGRTDRRAFYETKWAGDRAYSAGRTGEAAALYAQAADRAAHRSDRDEAVFLEAAAYERMGDFERAKSGFERLAQSAEPGGEPARARFELARIAYQTGHPERGDALLDEIIARFSDDGIARRALADRLTRLDQTGGNRASLAWLEHQIAKLGGGALDEDLSYAHAIRLERAGALTRSRDELVACAERHPYPAGSLFDDALFRASEIDERLGHPARAIEDLRRMLYVREPSIVTGSYERPRFADAGWRIAELYRDRLGDRAAARAAFHAFYETFTTSVRRDDALWQEAKLYRVDGQTESACRTLRELSRQFPESRYVPCARALCPSFAAPDGGSCHDYLLR